MPLAKQWTGEGRAHAGLIFTNPKRFDLASLRYPVTVIDGLREILSDQQVLDLVAVTGLQPG